MSIELTLVVAALVLVTSGFGWAMRQRNARAHQAVHKEQALRAHVAAKAAASDAEASIEASVGLDPTRGDDGAASGPADDSLTESSVLAIHDLVRQLMKSGQWDIAEQWARRALTTDPQRVQVALLLAEICLRTARKQDFFDVMDRYIVTQRRLLSDEQWAKAQLMVDAMSRGAESDRPGDMSTAPV